MSNDQQINEVERYSYLLHYSREGTPVWLAHLDTMRLFERTFKRADLPLLWSQGFNPRPDIVFALPIGMGIECEDDLIQITLSQSLDSSDYLQRLNSLVPEGIVLRAMERIFPPKESIMAAVERAVYRVELPGVGDTAQAVFQGDAPIDVDYTRKGKTHRLHLRDLVFWCKSPSQDQVIYECAAGSSSNLRPDLFLTAMEQYGGCSRDGLADARIIREKLILNPEWREASLNG